MSRREWLLLGVLVAYTGLTAMYAHVWRSDLALWAYAVRLAPLKSRPASNYADALLASGQTDGLLWLYRAEQLTRQLHVPAYNRVQTERANRARLRALTR